MLLLFASFSHDIGPSTSCFHDTVPINPFNWKPLFTGGEEEQVIWQKAASPQHMDGIPYTLQGAAPSPHTVPSHGGWTPASTWFPGPLESTTQKATRSVQPFLQGSRSWRINRPTDYITYSVC